MSNVLYLIVIAGIVVAAVVLFRSTRNRPGLSIANQATRRALLPLDYVQDRETARLANMSAEDRDWEQASLQRNRDNEARNALAA